MCVSDVGTVLLIESLFFVGALLLIRKKIVEKVGKTFYWSILLNPMLAGVLFGIGMILTDNTLIMIASVLSGTTCILIGFSLMAIHVRNVRARARSEAETTRN